MKTHRLAPQARKRAGNEYQIVYGWDNGWSEALATGIRRAYRARPARAAVRLTADS